MTTTTSHPDVPVPEGAFLLCDEGFEVWNGEYRLVLGRRTPRRINEPLWVYGYGVACDGDQFADEVLIGIQRDDDHSAEDAVRRGCPSRAPSICVTPSRGPSPAPAARRQFDDRDGTPMMALVECASWCEYGNGHPDQFCREDQACWSPSEYVDLSLDVVHHEAGGDYPQQLGVMVRREPNTAGVVYLHTSRTSSWTIR